MKPNRRDLKAFMRLDYSGRIVPTSLILRKSMPKVGKWFEVPAYECCNPSFTTTNTTTAFICRNILLNGGFEEWEGGEAVVWGAGDQEATIVHSGYYSVLLGNRASSTFQYFTPTNTCFTIDLWYNAASEYCANYLIVRLGETVTYLQANGSWNVNPHQFDLPATNQEWVNVVQQVYSTADTLHVIILGASNRECEVYYDDVQICDGCDPSVTTTTTTTSIPCEGPFCSSTLTVGQSEGALGFASGEGGYGTLDPDCDNIALLSWYDGTLTLYTSTCYTSVTVQIDGQQFVMNFVGEGEFFYAWIYTPTDNPFAIPGDTNTIRICGVECTTTTTTTEVPTTTTTTTEQPG